jgi:hypothetical protein
MPLGDVVTKYETRNKTMLGEIDKTTVWRDSAGESITTIEMTL